MASQAPRLIELVNKPLQSLKSAASFKPQLMEHWAQGHKLLNLPSTSSTSISNVGGDRSYMLLGSLAKLERALMNWTMNELIKKHNFTPVVVPNVIYDNIIERCGFATQSERSQVYKISGNNEESILDKNAPLSNSQDKTHSCLAGTSEFALVSVHIGDTIPSQELPKKFCALSRCYRAETSNSSSEWGMYRVHYFNKIEMVSLTMPDKSEAMHNEFLAIQRDLFSQLGLHFQILEMPDNDLGLSANRKYDIEAWMEGRQRYGEISSTSNCQDYQSSRLNIKYSQMIERDNQLQIDSGFVHTINGTACSSARTLIALIEQHQTKEGTVKLPKPLIPYMNGVDTLPTPQDVEALKDYDWFGPQEVK